MSRAGHIRDFGHVLPQEGPARAPQHVRREVLVGRVRAAPHRRLRARRCEERARVAVGECRPLARLEEAPRVARVAPEARPPPRAGARHVEDVALPRPQPRARRRGTQPRVHLAHRLVVPAADRIGEEGQGWECLLHGLNPERILIAAEAVGLGQAALERASTYARERVVFDRPIGMNQAIQHPLAVNWMELESAHLMVLKAATLYDAGKSCGAEANSAKYLAAEAGLRACQRSVLTHGGMGYAREFHVERYLREIQIPVIAPISQELIKSFIAERVLDQPKSY